MMTKLAQQIKFGPLQNIATPRFPSGSTIGDIVSRLVLFIFPIAGLLLLLYLLYGGYKYMLSKGDPKALQEARGAITTALLGFAIVFVSFWIVQIVGIIFGIEQITVIFGSP